MIKLPTLPLAVVQSVAAKQVIKQFASKFDFVYFGRVTAGQDEQKMIRGVTISTQHKDQHYAIGTFQGYDVMIVDRQNTLNDPEYGNHTYHWTIMQIDLKLNGLPHMFLDAHHHDAVFYTDLFTKFGYFETAESVFSGYDPLFLKHFKIFAKPSSFMHLTTLLTQQEAAMLAHHFTQFDYEIEDDVLRIYASNAVITIAMLREMLRVGTWLAKQLNDHSR